MRLLYRSMLRHLKQHAVQTGLTLAVTALFIGLLSALFYFAAGFGAVLRENALETVGEYHYCYYAKAESGSRVVLEWMAESLGKDDWFSDVTLSEEGEELSLYLTVASPGILTSKKMDKIFGKFAQQYMEHYSARDKSPLTIGHSHNLELLASYGDLSRENGIYSLLAVFFLSFALIALLAVLTLAAVYGVSASQREREFALLAGIGADGRQIKSLVLAESAFYIGTGIPAGLLLGIALFRAGKPWLDTLVDAIGYPPVRLVFSLPFGAGLTCSAAGIVLISGMLPARKAAAVSPMRILAGEEMYTVEEPGTGRKHAAGKSGRKRDFYGTGNGGAFKGEPVEVWLAYKSRQRFRRRFRPVLLALSVTFSLCFVPGSVGIYIKQILEIAGERNDYNISVELWGDDRERVAELAGEIAAFTGYELSTVWKARFDLSSSLPFSGEAEAAGFLTGGMLPDILLVSPGEALWEEICRDNPTVCSGDGIRGIFVAGNRQWAGSDGTLHRGEPFAVREGDVIPVYSSRDEMSAGQAAFEILIAGVAEDLPLCLDTEPGTRITVMVSEETFRQVEPLQHHIGGEPGMHHVSLRGICKDADEAERIARACIDGQEDVAGSVINCEEALRKDRAMAAGFRSLCIAFIALLSVAAVCGNFTVSWAVDMSRRKEYMVLSSIGMKPEEMRKMRYWELLFQAVAAILAGLPSGLLCHYAVFHMYSMEYGVDWRFPWQGLGMGLALLAAQILITEAERHLTLPRYSPGVIPNCLLNTFTK